MAPKLLDPGKENISDHFGVHQWLTLFKGQRQHSITCHVYRKCKNPLWVELAYDYLYKSMENNPHPEKMLPGLLPSFIRRPSVCKGRMTIAEVKL